MSSTKDPANGPVGTLIVKALSWVDDPKLVLRFFWWLVGIGVVLTLLDFTYKKKVYFITESNYGFYSFYGFFMCAALVVAAKGMRRLLMRNEDYYAPDDVASEEHPEFDLDKRQADV